MFLDLTLHDGATGDAPRRTLVNASMIFKITAPTAAQLAAWPHMGACVYLASKNDEGYWSKLWVTETLDQIRVMMQPRQTVVYGSPEFPIVELPDTTRART